MKTRFVKAAVLMLAISLLAVAASFTVTAVETPVSEFTANWSLSASPQTVNLDGVNSQTVTVTLVTNKAGVYCDGIAGRWDLTDTTGNVQLKLSADNSGLVINGSILKTGNTDEMLNTQQYAYPITGEFMWVNSIKEPVSAFDANLAIVTATYVIDSKTPTGTYVINFTKTVYAGETTVDETEETLSIAIQVNGHTCTPGEWQSDATKHWKECTVCNKELTEFTMDHIGGTANCQSGAICTGCGHAYTDKDLTKHTAVTYVIGETTHWQKCTACGTEKIDGSEHAHEYILVNNQCICGAVKPVTNVDVDYKGAALKNAYTVNGQVVTVTYSSACKVGYLQDGKYVTTNITKNEISDNCYSFTIPDGVTEVVLIVKGDITGDGRFLANDKAAINAALSGKMSLSADKTFAGDITGDGRFLANDKAAINAILAGKITLAW